MTKQNKDSVDYDFYYYNESNQLSLYITAHYLFMLVWSIDIITSYHVQYETFCYEAIPAFQQINNLAFEYSISGHLFKALDGRRSSANSALLSNTGRDLYSKCPINTSSSPTSSLFQLLSLRFPCICMDSDSHFVYLVLQQTSDQMLQQMMKYQRRKRKRK